MIRSASALALLMVLASSVQGKVPDPALTFRLDRIVTDLSTGTKIGPLKLGLLCAPAKALRWRTDASIEQDRARAVFADRFGYREDADAHDNPFAQKVQSTAYAVVARLVDVHADLCMPRRLLGDHSVKGRTDVAVHWEVWSPRSQRLVVAIDTSASQFGEEKGGADTILMKAFAANIDELRQSPDLPKR